MSRAPGRHDGFTIIEVLVAAALALGALALVVPLMRHAGDATRTLPATADIDQRARAAVSIIERILMRAGEGTGVGPYAGPLTSVVPAVFPHRRRISAGDAPLSAFTDRLTVWRFDGSLARTGLSAAMTSSTDPLALWWDLPCDAMNTACRFAADDLALITDRRARFAAMRVVAPSAGSLGHLPADLGTAFQLADDPQVLRLRVTTLSFDAASRQIRMGEGGAESPLIDHVASFGIRYFGDPEPPTQPRPPLGQATCLFDAAGSRLLPVLVATDGPWAELTPAMLSDGPTCGAGASSYDPDLLRIRRVVVRIRLEAVDDAVRGVDPLRFFNPGSARSMAVSDDREVVIDVAPRNLMWH